MSKISKYLQMSPKLLLEYTYDISATPTGTEMDAYVVKGRDGRLVLLNNPTRSNVAEYGASSVMFSSFTVSSSENERRTIGFAVTGNSDDYLLPDRFTEFLARAGYVTSLGEGTDGSLTDLSGWKTQNCRAYISHDSVAVPMDRVRIYLATGYTFADMAGFVLNVKAYQSAGSEYPSTDGEVVLRNFLFTKRMLSTLVEFAPKPFYQLSKFYDRYIDVYVPSAYYMALNKRKGGETSVFDVLNIEYGNQVVFDYAEIESEMFNDVAYGEDGYVDIFGGYPYVSLGLTDKVLYSQGKFSVSGYTTAQVALNSNSDNFNLRLYEDKDVNCIRFYPVWGPVTDDNPITRRIMNGIENGSIPLSMSGFYDANDTDLDDFEAIYGEDARKWIVVNELDMDFVYQPMVSSNAFADNEIVISRKFNYTEDFEGDNDNISNIDNIYKYVYRPVVESLNNGFVCDHIRVTYTGRLVNRLNGEEVIRTATLVVPEAESKFGVGSSRVDVSNVYTWKLFNKVEPETVSVTGNAVHATETKYVTKFVESSSFAVSDGNGNAVTSGDYVIRLYETSNLYRIRLYTDSTLSVPYELTEANVSPMLRVSLGAENMVSYLKPTNSADMNTTAGMLEFNVSDVLAKGLLAGDRKWALIAQATSGEVTTVFAGRFESVYGD